MKAEKMNPQRKYQEAKVRTASPEQLMVMLFDGAIRFAEQAKAKLGAKNYEESCHLLLRSQKILTELIGALSAEDLGREVYEKLSGHYWFAHGRLVRANIEHELKWIDEALYVLCRIRDNWAAAISTGEVPPAAPDTVTEVKSTEAGALSSLNIQG